MTLSLSQIMSWDPSVLTEIGNGWTTLGSKVEDLFARYRYSVAAVNGGHWEGAAADAAMHRAESDQRAAHQLVGHLNRAAKVATDGFGAINGPLQQARAAIAEATSAGYVVREDLSVYKPGKSTEDDEDAMRRFAERITSAANATEAADDTVRNALSATRGDLRAAFATAAGSGGAQARADANHLLEDPSHLTPEELARLAAAGSLSPEQLDALQAGEPVNIPASQMEYLNGLARSLDGKTPEEIETILNTLPADARRSVANALQLVSNERVMSNITGLGEDNWPNADGRHGGLVNIMSIMDSDLTKNPGHPGAGEIFNAGAVAAMTAQERLFAHAPHAPDANSHLIASGIIQGALDQGLMTALQNDATNHQTNPTMCGSTRRTRGTPGSALPAWQKARSRRRGRSAKHSVTPMSCSVTRSKTA